MIERPACAKVDLKKQKAQIMEKSSKDNVHPEQELNKVLQPIDTTSSPSIANAHVVCSQVS